MFMLIDYNQIYSFFMNQLFYPIQRYSNNILILFSLFVLSISSVNAQIKRSRLYDDYINQYSSIAVAKMTKHKIPASITLAQGLLESGAGQSILATQGNNHFGIKCHTEWNGATMRKTDDRPDECFRKYRRAEESYEDHSLFLTGRSRYDSLFRLQTTDYKGWARGLQTAGYATDKAYANKLIKLIEDYELYHYDANYKKSEEQIKTTQPTAPAIKTYAHTPYRTHGLVYVVANRGDSYKSIAEEFDFNVKDLCKYNEVPKDFPLSQGDIVYFEKKKPKADKPYYEHVVKVGESMYSISQRYGMQVKNLYKMNKKDYEYVPVEGDILKLR